MGTMEIVPFPLSSQRRMFMNFLEIARARQSCRAYDETKAVEQEKLEAILDYVTIGG